MAFGQNEISADHFVDADGNPAGGTTTGNGMCISWQHGPLGQGDTKRPPTGAFVEGAIKAAINRLEFYQRSPFACQANADAIHHLEQAIVSLDSRTADRETRDVEGLNEE